MLLHLCVSLSSVKPQFKQTLCVCGWPWVQTSEVYNVLMCAYVCACVCAEAAFALNECVFPLALRRLKASFKSLTTRIHRQPITNLLQMTVMDSAVLDVDFSHSRPLCVSQKTLRYGWWPWSCSSVWLSLFLFFLFFFLLFSLFFLFPQTDRSSHRPLSHLPLFSLSHPYCHFMPAISSPMLFTPNLPSLWSFSRHVWLIHSDDIGRLLCVSECECVEISFACTCLFWSTRNQ